MRGFSWRVWVVALVILASGMAAALAEPEKKTDDDKPADPDTGESTVEEKTLGLLPQPFQSYGVKFAATYIGESLANVSGGLRRGAIYEGRLNLAVDIDLGRLAGWEQWAFHATSFRSTGKDFHGIISRTI
jgi:porin